jgi:hypothetical protein
MIMVHLMTMMVLHKSRYTGHAEVQGAVVPEKIVSHHFLKQNSERNISQAD